MIYRLVYTKRSVEDIQKLDTLARRRIGERLRSLENDPLGKSRKLLNPRIGTYRYRIGDYRAVFDISGRDVVVLRVGHRREIYR